MIRPGPLVLMYHGIAAVAASADPHNLFVPPERFEAQLVALRKAGFHPLDVDGYLAVRARSAPAAGRHVLLTFDDGYVSMLEAAAPLLAEHGFPALCFISAGLLGDRSQGSVDPAYNLMNADQVSSLPEHGIDVGVHGWNHQSMTAMPADALRRNIQDARSDLGQLLGKPPVTFAYPYGDHDPAARDAVRQAGYQVAFSTHDGDGLMAVPRVDVNATDSERSFAIKLNRCYPVARRALGTVGPIRALVHRAVGSADRSLRNGDDTP